MSIINRNNVNISGHGQRALVFMHGFGCDQHVWRHTTAAFEKDWRIVLFDHGDKSLGRKASRLDGRMLEGRLKGEDQPGRNNDEKGKGKNQARPAMQSEQKRSHRPSVPVFFVSVRPDQDAI